MAAKQNLIVDQGEDYQRVLTLKDNSDVPLNLTGYTFKGMAKHKYEDATAAFEFEFTVRDQVTYTGVVDMLIPASETSDFVIGKQTKYKYDIEMIDGNNITRRIIEGEILLNPEVTR